MKKIIFYKSIVVVFALISNLHLVTISNSKEYINVEATTSIVNNDDFVLSSYSSFVLTYNLKFYDGDFIFSMSNSNLSLTSSVGESTCNVGVTESDNKIVHHNNICNKRFDAETTTYSDVNQSSSIASVIISLLSIFIFIGLVVFFSLKKDNNK